MAASGNLLSGTFDLQSVSNAIEVYDTVITTNTDLSSISTTIEARVNDIFSGKSRANNGYNSILTYIAAEAIIAVITQTAITASGSTTPPDKISANFTTINASGDVEITSATGSSSASTGALKVDGGVGITQNLNVAGNATVTGNLSLTAIPTQSTHAVTKAYVDGFAQGLTVKESVVAATATGTSYNFTDFVENFTLDGVTLAADDRILIKNGLSVGQEVNYGVYKVSSNGDPPTRTSDFYGTYAKPGSFLFVQKGNLNADTGWVLINDTPFNIGTDVPEFTQFSNVELPQQLATTSSPEFAGITINTTAGIDLAAAIDRDNTTQQADSANITTNLNDIYAKIRRIDDALLAVLKNIDVSSGLSSSNPFYNTAGYSGNNTITNTYALTYS